MNRDGIVSITLTTLMLLSAVVSGVSLVGSAPAQASHSGTTVYVDATAGTGGDGSPANPYGTIQKGINHANSGDTVVVDPGTYNETVVVNKSVSVVGNGTGVIVDGGGREGTGFLINNETTALDNVSVEGVSITNFSSSQDPADGAGIRVGDETSNVTINGTAIDSVGSNGISLYSAGSQSDIVISNATISNASQNGIGVRAGSGDISGLTVRDIEVEDTVSGSGLIFAATGDGRLADISLSDINATDLSSGIEFQATENSTIESVSLTRVTLARSSGGALTIEASGPSATIRNISVAEAALNDSFAAGGSGYKIGAQIAASEDATISNVELTETNASGNEDGIQAFSRNSSTISGLTIDTVDAGDQNRTGIALSTDDTGSIVDTTISDVAVNNTGNTGLRITSQAESTITNTTISGANATESSTGAAVVAGDNTTVGDLHVENLLATNNSGGVYVIAGTSASADATVTDVTVIENALNDTGTGLFLTGNGASQITDVNATTNDFTGSTNGISGTFENTSELDTLDVSENLLNDSTTGVNLNAQDSSSVTNATITENALNESGAGVRLRLTDSATGAEITAETNTFENNTYGVLATANGNSTLSGVSVTEALATNSTAGISITGSGMATVTDISVQDALLNETLVGSEVRANDDAAIENVSIVNVDASNSSSGIIVESTGHGSITDVNTSRVLAEDVSGSGVTFQAGQTSSDASTISNVTVSEVVVNGTATTSGIQLHADGTQSRLDTVSLETVLLNGNAAGLDVSADNDSSIESVSGSSLLLEDGQSGIAVNGTSGSTIQLTVRESLIRDNSKNGVEVAATAPATGITIHRSIIARNDRGVDNQNVSSVVDARFNYWGDSSGPGSDASSSLADPETGKLANGAGNTVSEGATAGVANVRFSPAIGGKGDTGPQLIDPVPDQQLNLSLGGETISGPLTDFIGVNVWERSILPFRTDNSDAETRVELPLTFVRVDGTDVSINRDSVGVHTKGDPVSLSLSKLTEANTSRFNGEEVQLVVLRPNESAETSADLSSLFTSNVNETTGNVTASSDLVEVAEIRSLGELSGGTLETEFTPQQSGDYVALLATVETGDGFERTGDGGLRYNLQNDSTTLIGGELITVQSTSSTVTPDRTTVQEGQEVSFTAESNLERDNVVHAVLTYNKEEFTDQTIIVESSDSEQLSSGLVQVELSGTVDGNPFLIEANVSSNGTVTDFTSSGSMSDVDSSLKVVTDGDATETITLPVGENANLDDGESTQYNYLHVAVAQQNASVRSTSAGSITVERDSEAFVTDFELSNDRIRTGEELIVTATIDRNGDTNGETVELIIDGEVVQTKFTELENGSTETIEFRTSFDTEGVRDISIDGLPNKTVEVTDEEAFVSSFKLSSKRITVGQKLTISATVDNPGDAEQETVELYINGKRVKQKTVSVAANSQKTVRFTRRFSSTGKRKIRVDNLKSKTVSVIAGESDDDGDGGGGGGGIGGGGGAGGGGGGDGGPDTDVIRTPSGVTITVGATGISERIDVDLGDSASRNGTGLVGLSIETFGSSGGFRVEVTPPQTTPPSGVPPVEERRDGARALNYFTATPAGSDLPEFRNVNYTFTVSDSDLPDDVSTDRVVLLRYNETTGQWNRLPTTALGDGRFSAQSPGFSAYAIGIRSAQQEAQFTVQETSIGSEELTVGEETSVGATIQNDGGSSGTFTAELTVDGEVVDTREVTLDSGESTTIEFALSFDSPGTYDVAISGTDVATVSVQEATDTATATQTQPATTTPPGDGGYPTWAIVLIILLLAALAGYLYLRYRDEEMPEPLQTDR